MTQIYQILPISEEKTIRQLLAVGCLINKWTIYPQTNKLNPTFYKESETETKTQMASISQQS